MQGMRHERSKPSIEEKNRTKRKALQKQKILECKNSSRAKKSTQEGKL